MYESSEGPVERCDLSVGWAGTGRMGVAMARRLAEAGVAVAAWNRTAERAAPLAAYGAEVVGSLAGLRSRDVVFTMVADEGALERVLLGEDGLLRAGPDRGPGIVVDCSTVSPGASRALQKACAERGTAFLAAPVSGNAKAVAAGRLGVVVSGPRAAYERVAPLLRLVGRSVTYAGKGDSARLVKIAHNLVLGIVTQALAETAVLAEKGGVPRRAYLEFLNDSVLGSEFTRYKTPALVSRDYTPTFTPVLLRKDFDLGLDAGRALDVPLPLAAATAQLVQSCVSTGRGAADFAVLLELQAAASGLTLAPDDGAVSDGLTTAPEPENPGAPS
ncbi:2-hydroxy-3-oxopropionate reductase (plasmid) [Streptomyces sp. YIM 121038]|uniref:NAD(P)-dependent oxidoreductase n=1 Tax=Streptomyces sp. YIM 121038 TaxID=2136401 RepID=UPI001110604C|nr:NAD(P)-dependent oxidoreductase [Streptomyces sp. YIM 121038]QCX82763.1 2-hydroxy-3-oxopropionate reductase [Streptomyces sp. YIM 121038]